MVVAQVAGVAIGVFAAVLVMKGLNVRIAGRRLGEWVAILVVLLVLSVVFIF